MTEINRLSFFIIAIIFLSLLGCSLDSNKNASELFSEAEIILETSSLEDDNYSDVFNSYQRANDNIEQLLSRYPSSDIAISLISGDKKITGLTLSEFYTLEEELQLLEKTNPEPISLESIPVLIKKFQNSPLKSDVLFQIANAYAQSGELNEAIRVIAEIEDALYKALAQSNLVSTYIDLGELNQALEIANTIEIIRFKSRALADISKRHYELEQFQEALETANKIEDSQFKNEYIGELAMMHSVAGRSADAIEAAKSIDDSQQHTKILLELANVHLKPYENEVRAVDGIRIETSDAVFQASTSQAISGANMVKERGYRCNSISKFKPLILSNGFHLTCNNWQYEYELRDVGGNIRVIAK